MYYYNSRKIKPRFLSETKTIIKMEEIINEIFMDNNLCKKSG